MPTTTKIKEKLPKEKEEVIVPKFRDPSELTLEQLTDPDYRAKQLMKFDGQLPLTCSKCHHCR